MEKCPTNKIAPKLIALDLDDSLLNNRLQITEKSVKIIKQATESGIYIVICSGRAPSAIFPFVHTLNLAGSQYGRYAIASNGTVIFDMHTRQEIYSAKVGYEVLHHAKEVAEKAGLPCQVYGSSTIYTGVDNKYTRLDSELTGMELKVVPDFDNFLKAGYAKMIIPGDEKVLVEIQKTLKSDFGNKAVVFTSKPYFLEIMPPDCGKGEALEILSQRLGFSMKEVMAFGDSMNDESMIVKSGMSVAMCNGLDIIKEEAVYVTQKSNQDDGIADFIEKFVL